MSGVSVRERAAPRPRLELLDSGSQGLLRGRSASLRHRHAALEDAQPPARRRGVRSVAQRQGLPSDVPWQAGEHTPPRRDCAIGEIDFALRYINQAGVPCEVLVLFEQALNLCAVTKNAILLSREAESHITEVRMTHIHALWYHTASAPASSFALRKTDGHPAPAEGSCERRDAR